MIVKCVKCGREYDALPMGESEQLLKFCEVQPQPTFIPPTVYGTGVRERMRCPVWMCSGELDVTEAGPK